MNLFSKYSLLSLACLLSMACSRDNADDVEFDVSIADINGQNVTFAFSGNAEYIAFYPGTQGNNYTNSGRVETEISELKMSCNITQQYNDASYLNQEIIHIYLSTDFSGIYTSDELNKATWTPISGLEFNRLPVPVPTSASAVAVSGDIDLSAYINPNEQFYIAFQYNAAGRSEIPSANGSGKYITRPRVDVSNLELQKTTTDGELFIITNAITEWGFRPIYQESVGSNYQVNDNGLLFQPQKGEISSTTGKENNEVVWMVSTLINPQSVEPDRGIAIKSIEASLPTYTHSYGEAGNYTATFIATNASLWDSRQIVKQITVNIQP